MCYDIMRKTHLLCAIPSFTSIKGFFNKIHKTICLCLFIIGTVNYMCELNKYTFNDNGEIIPRVLLGERLDI